MFDFGQIPDYGLFKALSSGKTEMELPYEGDDVSEIKDEKKKQMNRMAERMTGFLTRGIFDSQKGTGVV